MTPAQVSAAIEIIRILVPLGIELGTAAASALRGIFGNGLTPAELEAMIAELEQDATYRAYLASLDAGG